MSTYFEMCLDSLRIKKGGKGENRDKKKEKLVHFCPMKKIIS